MIPVLVDLMHMNLILRAAILLVVSWVWTLLAWVMNNLGGWEWDIIMCSG